MSAHRVLALILAASFATIALVLAPARAAPVAASEEPGVIAYVQRSTHDIHVISPDGTGDRVLWAAPQPLSLYPPYDLAWRPDGGELAFSSEHEETCSLYQSDVYAIGYFGSGYRRITNSPACAALASMPKGSVTVNVANAAGPLAQVYVQGAPSSKFAESGTMTFDNVADFGPGVVQPTVGIYLGYYGEVRAPGSPPFADVQPNQTVSGGSLTIPGAGAVLLAAGKVSWNADGSALAYGMRSFSSISEIGANPPFGSVGEPLPVVQHAAPNLVAWGPDAAHSDLYLYFSKDDILYPEVAGIYLNTLANPGGGTQLVYIDILNGQMVPDIEWLPDASGFLFSATYIDLGIFTDIFEYNFTTEELTRLTSLPDGQGARGFSISPDGQQIVFEWVTEPWDPTSSLWIIDRDGSGLRKLADDAGRPAWGPTYVAQAPHAEFVATPTTGVSPLLVQFSNQSTGDYDICTWSFGDGSTSTSCGNPSHTYATKGVYTVALTVSGPGGTDTRTRPGYIAAQAGYTLSLPFVVRGQ
jgi:hypothetical protein